MNYSYQKHLQAASVLTWYENGVTTVGTLESPMTEFLLESAPFLHRYHQANQIIQNFSGFLDHNIPTPAHVAMALQDAHDAHRGFLRKFEGSKQQPPVDLANIMSHCRHCSSENSRVDVQEEAAFVCTSCGIVSRYSIPTNGGLDYEDRIRLNPSTYAYSPTVYFLKILYERQGLHTGTRAPLSVLKDLAIYFVKRHVPSLDITPERTRAALRSLKKQNFYPIRWTLTRRLNPEYPLLFVSHNLTEQLLAIFQTMARNFPTIIKQLNLLRNNLPSYPFFTKTVLLHLGYPDKARAFSELKSPRRHDEQVQIMQVVLQNVPRRRIQYK